MGQVQKFTNKLTECFLIVLRKILGLKELKETGRFPHHIFAVNDLKRKYNTMKTIQRFYLLYKYKYDLNRNFCSFLSQQARTLIRTSNIKLTL